MYYIILLFLTRNEVAILEYKVNNLMKKLDETHKYDTGRKQYNITESGKDDNEL